MARLGVRRPVVLGHSYGGAVAMAWALQDEAGTGALVILSGATMPWPGGLGLWYTLIPSLLGRVAIIPVLSAWAPFSRTRAVINSIFLPDPVPPGYENHIGAGLTMRRGSLRTNARQVAGLKPHVTAMAQDYPRLTLPVEIVHGLADTIVPATVHAGPLAKLLPGARLTLLPEAAHMPHHSHPDAVCAAIHRAAARAVQHGEGSDTEAGGFQTAMAAP